MNPRHDDVGRITAGRNIRDHMRIAQAIYAAVADPAVSMDLSPFTNTCLHKSPQACCRSIGYATMRIRPGPQPPHTRVEVRSDQCLRVGV